VPLAAAVPLVTAVPLAAPVPLVATVPLVAAVPLFEVVRWVPRKLGPVSVLGAQPDILGVISVREVSEFLG